MRPRNAPRPTAKARGARYCEAPVKGAAQQRPRSEVPPHPSGIGGCHCCGVDEGHERTAGVALAYELGQDASAVARGARGGGVGSICEDDGAGAGIDGCLGGGNRSWEREEGLVVSPWRRLLNENSSC